MEENLDKAYSENLLKLLNDSLRLVPPVAPTELYYDSQTKSIIKELENINGKIKLLDYGCGNLRLLQGLKISSSKFNDIEYIATDITAPGTNNVDKADYKFENIGILRRDYSLSFDVVVVMNVIHEITIHNIATIFEDVRRLLKPDGFFLLVDMSVLPEGEPLAMPFYSWEFEAFFRKYDNLSYSSKSGIPVIVLKIMKDEMLPYYYVLNILQKTVQIKRNTYSEVACQLHDPKLKAKFESLIRKLSLTGNNLYDLGLLMLLSGHANFRLMEEVNRASPGYEEINETAIAILELFFKTFRKMGRVITLNELFQEIGSEQSYDSILHAITQMSNSIGCFFFPIKDPHAPLQPSESIDAFEDYYSYDDIRKVGLYFIQLECHKKMWPDF